MNPLSDLPPLPAIIARHGLATKKSLGQHFLLDEAITDRVARYAGELSGINVIEIGPGPGGLTRSLLRSKAAGVYVVEKDDRCIAVMQELQQAAGGRLHILHADALEVDLIARVPAPRKIVANLPYNVGTELLLKWLGQIYKPSPLEGEGRVGGEGRFGVSARTTPHPNPPPQGGRGFASLTLMFQKEVAQRIVAAHGNKDYGRLSVICQWLCECRYDMELPPGAFSPPPKVDSAVVTLTPRDKPLVDVPKEILEKVVAAAFGQRRKMLRGALKSLGCDVEKLLDAAGIDGSLRAEQLDVATLCRLAQCYVSSCGSP